jgi:hypothetical protein
MRFFKWRIRKKGKSERHSNSPIIGTPSNALFSNNPPIVIDNEDSSGPYVPSQTVKNQVVTVAKHNGDTQKRKTSRVSFQLGPAIVPADLPPKSLSECGTVSSVKYPRPSLKAANPLGQSNNEPVIIEFDNESYISYVIKVGRVPQN